MLELLALLSTPEAWIAFAVLTLMEIVLGIDNIVFITILCGRLPREKQLFARRLGLAVALVSRLGLLLTISWIMKLQEPFFEIAGRGISGKDLILIGGGIFLIYKATHEIFENVERPAEHQPQSVGDDMGDAAAREAEGNARRLMLSIVGQVVVLDIVFSLDSVITAVGMASHVEIMIAAMVLAVVVMLIFAGPVGDFIQTHPSVRVLALAFLILIGVMLVIEGWGDPHSVVPPCACTPDGQPIVPVVDEAHGGGHGLGMKGYIYAAMGFALFIELLNMRMRSRLDRLKGRAEA
jgi:predicted tellurium resistance membrane protein TerC